MVASDLFSERRLPSCALPLLLADGSKSRSARAPVYRGSLCCPCTTGGFRFSKCPSLTLAGIAGHLLPELPRWICHVAFVLSSPAFLRPAVAVPAEDLTAS